MKRFTICFVLLLAVVCTAGQAHLPDSNFAHRNYTSTRFQKGHFYSKETCQVRVQQDGGVVVLSIQPSYQEWLLNREAASRVSPHEQERVRSLFKGDRFLLSSPGGDDRPEAGAIQLGAQINSVRIKPQFTKQFFEEFLLPTLVDNLILWRRYERR